MVIHNKVEEMLKESIQEMLDAASLCINFKKENNGCLGYPATILLLSIADTIGSYYEGNKNFKIKVDGKEKFISGNSFQHFYIFNSEYYNLQLTDKFIQKIYKNFRSLLVHNGVIAQNHYITINDPLHRCFCDDDGFTDQRTGETYPSIHLKPLLNTTSFAVLEFKKKIDEIYPVSRQASIQDRRRLIK